MMGVLTALVIGATTVVSGTTDLEDSAISSLATDNSWGGRNSNVWVGRNEFDNETNRALLRVLYTAIPSGSISAARWKVYRPGNAGACANGNTLELFTIKAANAGWIEGAGDGFYAGAACWTYTVWNTSSWAGSAGCSTSGTDYDATAVATYAYDAYTSGTPVLYTITFSDVSHLESWRDGSTSPGYLVKAQDEVTAGSQFWINTTENPTTPWTLEIDVAASITTPLLMPE